MNKLGRSGDGLIHCYTAFNVRYSAKFFQVNAVKQDKCCHCFGWAGRGVRPWHCFRASGSSDRLPFSIYMCVCGAKISYI